jgi:ribonuclease Z
MNIHFLGTSSGCPSLSRNVSATAVSFDNTKSWLLVDCGEGTQHQILKSELTSYHLSVILITHLHGDHCYGLPGLLASISMAGRTAPVNLIAPQAVIDFVQITLTLTQVEPSFELIFTPIETVQATLDFNFCQVQVVPLKHRVASVGFKIIESCIPRKLQIEKLQRDGIESGPHYNQLQKGQDVIYKGQKLLSYDYSFTSWRARKVIICGDNEKPNLLKEYVFDIDLLVHEATFTHADLMRVGLHTGHSDAKRIAEFAEQTHIAKLALFHFSSRYHGEGMLEVIEKEASNFYSGALVLAYDGLKLNIDKVKQTAQALSPKL